MALTPRVAAIIRRLSDLSPPELDELAVAVVEFAAPTDRQARREMDVQTRRRSAVAAVGAVACALGLADGEAPTSKQFRELAPEHAPGWSLAAVIRACGSWRGATESFLGRSSGPTARQRGYMRAARRGVHRDRDDYLESVRLWLATNPPSRSAADYDAWRIEHNAKLGEGELRAVSYSMLRKVLPWGWDTTKAIADGLIDTTDAPARRPIRRRLKIGPHDLIAFSHVREISGLGITAARNLTYAPGFPAPAYTQPRPPHIRLWVRRDVERFVRGHPVTAREANYLQSDYLDAQAVAEILGLARITVTTRSSPRVPEPSVMLGGMQLWLRHVVLAGSEA